MIENCADCGGEADVESGYWIEGEVDTFVLSCSDCAPETEPVDWYSEIIERGFTA